MDRRRHRRGHKDRPLPIGNDPGPTNDNHLASWPMAGLACGCVVGGLLVAFTGELVFLTVPAIGAVCGLALAFGAARRPGKRSRPLSSEIGTATESTPDHHQYGEQSVGVYGPNSPSQTAQAERESLSH